MLRSPGQHDGTFLFANIGFLCDIEITPNFGEFKEGSMADETEETTAETAETITESTAPEHSEEDDTEEDE